MVQLRQHRGELCLVKWGRVDTPAGIIDRGLVNDPIKLGEAISSLFSQLGVRKPGVAAAVSGQQIFLRHLTLPLMPHREMVQAIKYQLQGLLRIPSAEIRYDFIRSDLNTQPSEDGLIEVTVVATRRSVIEGLKESIVRAGAIPLVLGIEPLAIYRLLQSKEPVPAAPSRVLLVSIGRTITQLSIFEQGVLRFNRTLMLNAATDQESVDFQNVVREVSTEVWRTLEYYQLEYPEAQVERILLTGEATRFGGFSAVLGQVDIPIIKLDPLARIRFEKSVTEAEAEELRTSYGVALGLAASVIDAPAGYINRLTHGKRIPSFRRISWPGRLDRHLCANQINLFREDNLPDSSKKNLILIGALSLLLAFSLPGYLCYSLSQKVQEQESRYQELRDILIAKGLLVSQGANRDLFASTAWEKELQLSQWQIDRDQWSKTLSEIYKTIPVGCYLKEIRQYETGVRLIGQARSYPDLAQFIAAIEELEMFTEVDLINSKYDSLAKEVPFELQCNRFSKNY
jgi:type IV pilus assembly protein PilM